MNQNRSLASIHPDIVDCKGMQMEDLIDSIAVGPRKGFSSMQRGADIEFGHVPRETTNEIASKALQVMHTVLSGRPAPSAPEAPKRSLSEARFLITVRGELEKMARQMKSLEDYVNNYTVMVNESIN